MGGSGPFSCFGNDDHHVCPGCRRCESCSRCTCGERVKASTVVPPKALEILRALVESLEAEGVSIDCRTSAQARAIHSVHKDARAFLGAVEAKGGAQ